MGQFWKMYPNHAIYSESVLLHVGTWQRWRRQESWSLTTIVAALVSSPAPRQRTASDVMSTCQRLVTSYASAQIIATLAEVTPKGDLVRESFQNPLHSGLGWFRSIVVCPEINVTLENTTLINTMFRPGRGYHGGAVGHGHWPGNRRPHGELWVSRTGMTGEIDWKWMKPSRVTL